MIYVFEFLGTLVCMCFISFPIPEIVYIYVCFVSCFYFLFFCWADSELAVIRKKVDDFYFSVTRLKNDRSKRLVQLARIYIYLTYELPMVLYLNFFTFCCWTSLLFDAEHLTLLSDACCYEVNFFAFCVMNFLSFWCWTSLLSFVCFRSKIMFQNNECEATVEDVATSFSPRGMLRSNVAEVALFCLRAKYQDSEKLILSYWVCVSQPYSNFFSVVLYPY